MDEIQENRDSSVLFYKGNGRTSSISWAKYNQITTQRTWQNITHDEATLTNKSATNISICKKRDKSLMGSTHLISIHKVSKYKVKQQEGQY